VFGAMESMLFRCL